MKVFLQTKGLFKYLRATYVKPRAATAAEIASMAATGTSAATISTVQTIIDAREQFEEDTDKIIGYFILKMTSSLQQLHAGATNAKTLWDSLAMAYATTGSLYYKKNGKGDTLEGRSRFISPEPTLGRDLHTNLGKVIQITNRSKQVHRINLLLTNINVLLQSKTMVIQLPPPNPLMVLTMSVIDKIARIRKWQSKL